MGQHPNNFNPRPPRGGRLHHGAGGGIDLVISIHVLREEDDLVKTKLAFMRQISIHVLREEDDAGFCPEGAPGTDFNPRPPRGGRLRLM